MPQNALFRDVTEANVGASWWLINYEGLGCCSIYLNFFREKN